MKEPRNAADKNHADKASGWKRKRAKVAAPDRVMVTCVQSSPEAKRAAEARTRATEARASARRALG